MNCVVNRKKTKPSPRNKAVESETPQALSDFITALEDPDMRNYLKTSLGISDEQLKAHIQRLVEATAVQVDPKRGEK